MKVIEIKSEPVDNECGLIAVELFGKVRDLRFYRHVSADANAEERLDIYGFAVRYSQGEKIWSGCISYWPASGKFSRPDVPMHHRNRWAHVSVVGFYEDVPERYRSRHR